MPLSPTRGRFLRLSALVVALAAGTAVWTAHDSPGSSASGPPAPRRTAAAPADLAELKARPPLHGLLYTRTPADERVTRARHRLIADCMAEQGFRYEPVGSAGAPVGSATSSYPSPFGIEELPAGTGADGTEPPPEKPRSAAFVRALFGDPKARVSARGASLEVTRPATGCQAEAEKHLLGDGRVRWLELRLRLGDAEKEARGRVEKDPAFLRAGADWRACMKRQGFSHAGPLELLRGLPAEADVRRDPAVRADLRCKQETEYLPVAYAALARAQQAWLAENPEVLEEWKALQQRQDSAAGKALAAGRPAGG